MCPVECRISSTISWHVFVWSCFRVDILSCGYTFVWSYFRVDMLSCGHAFQCVFISHSELFISRTLQFFLICFLCWNVLICCWRFHLCCWSSHQFPNCFICCFSFLVLYWIHLFVSFLSFFLVNFWNFHLALYLLQYLWVH